MTPPSNQYPVEVPLAAITAVSISGQVCVSFPHLDTAVCVCPALLNSSSVRSDCERNIFLPFLCISSTVPTDFVIVSFTGTFLALTPSFWWQSGLGRFTAELYAFHFWMIALTVLLEIFSALEMFLYPSPDWYF